MLIDIPSGLLGRAIGALECLGNHLKLSESSTAAAQLENLHSQALIDFGSMSTVQLVQLKDDLAKAKSTIERLRQENAELRKMMLADAEFDLNT